MKKAELVFVAKNMVKEYFNKYVDKNKTKDIPKIKFNDVEVIGFCELGRNYRVLLVTPTTDGIYYEVAYDKRTDKIYSYPYKKVRTRKNIKDCRYYLRKK